MKIPMSREHRSRANQLVRDAYQALNQLRQEKLQLDPENQAQLMHVLGALDDFDYGLRRQPLAET